MNQKLKNALNEIDLSIESAADIYTDYPLHVPRGLVLSGCLHGESSYEQVSVYSDLTPGDDGAIAYDPEVDYRLDRFDAVELGNELAATLAANDGKQPVDKPMTQEKS